MKNCGTKQGTNQSVTTPNKRRLAACMKWLVIVVVGLTAQAGAAIRTSSISFDGVNSYALFANPFYQSQALTNWSVEMWFKTRNILEGNRGSQQLWGKSGFWKGVWISFETNGVIGCWYEYPSPQTYWAVVSGPGVVKNLTWHHVAAVMNGTNLQLFVDGNNVANAVGNGLVNWAQDSGGASTGLNMLGQEQDGNFGTNDRFNGMISEFRSWSKALTQAEIQNNMNMQLLPANHPELVDYWPMGQGSGSTVADLINTNTLTLYANAGWTTDAPPISQIEGSGIPTNLLQGLVAYYPFTGNANDASGNGNNGTVYGATLTADRFGNPNAAYLFGGTAAYITAPFSSSVFNSDFTVSAWFNAYDIADGWPTLLDEAGNSAFRMGIVGQTSGAYPYSIGRLYAYATHVSPNKDWEMFVPPPTLNTFYQVVVERAGTNVTMYLNAQLGAAGQVSSPTVEPGNTLYIGRQETEDVVGAYVFHGVIDDIRVYNRALSSNEVAQLYAIESTPLCLPRGATATATLADGFVVTATIIDGGCGYTNTPRVLIEGGGGTGAGATAMVSNGVVVGITITNAGMGYTSTPLVIIQPPFIPNPVLGIAPMSFLSFSNLTVGGVYQLQQSVGWYWSNQPVNFTATNALYTHMVAGVAGNGDYRLALNPVPAQAFATADVDYGFVVHATVTSGGSGYVTSPAVSIVGGGGSNATAVANLSAAGVVTNIAITDAGIGYTNTPTIEIAQPPAAAVSPTVSPVLRVDSTNLAPYDNYQIQFEPALGGTWGNWNGGLFTPTGVTNSQYLFITNGAGFFRLQYVP